VKDFSRWHSKAEKSISKAFKQYVDLEVEHETNEPLPAPWRKQAGNRTLYDDTMSVDLMLLTGARTFKKAKRVSQLDEYFNDLREDLTVVS
jgi:hypothetical protein